MSLTFYWRAESTTFTPDDYSVGDSTPTANNAVEISTTQARVGQSSIYANQGVEYYWFDSADILSVTQGSVAFWFYLDSFTANAMIFSFYDASSVGDKISLSTTGTDQVRMRVSRIGQGVTDLNSPSLNVDTWYGCVMRWHEGNQTARLELYDYSGHLIAVTENTNINATHWPLDANLDRFLLGDTNNNNPDCFIDNILISDNYREDLQDNLLITSVLQYKTSISEGFGKRITIGRAKNFVLADPLPQTRSLHVPDRWTHQPPAGTKPNPKWLNRGLEFLWHGNNPLVELVHGTSYDPANSAQIDIEQSTNGRILQGVGTSRDTQRLAFPSPQGRHGTGTTGFTVGGEINLDWDTDTGPTYLISKTLSNDGWFVRKREDTNTGVLHLFAETQSTTTLVGVAAEPYREDGWRHVTFVYDGSIPSAYGWLNGQRGTEGFNDASIGDVIEDPAGARVELHGGNNMSWEADCGHALWYIFDRALTADEIKFLANNPWDLFEPPSLHVPYEYEELTFDDKEERLFMIPQRARKQPR